MPEPIVLQQIREWNATARDWLRGRLVDARPPLDLLRQALADDACTSTDLESVTFHVWADGRIRAAEYLDRFSLLVGPLLDAVPIRLGHAVLDLLQNDPPGPGELPEDLLFLLETELLVGELRQLAGRPGRRP